MLGLVERAVRPTKPNLRRLAELQQIARNNTLRSIEIEIPKGGAHNLPPGFSLKEPKKDCGRC